MRVALIPPDVQKLNNNHKITMNITCNKIDPVNATVTIDVVKEDYINEVEKSMKDLRRSTVIPGFRKGMVPLSRIRLMYGKGVLVEVLNKLVNDKLHVWLREEKLNVLGEPLPNADKQETADFNREDFSFTFDVGLAPQVELNLSKKDKIPYYSVEITDRMIDERIESYRASYGSYDNAEAVEEKDLVKGVLTERDENGNPKADGILNENAVLMPEYIKDKEEKAKFIGAKPDATVVFNPCKAFEGNAAELSSFLNIKKDEAEKYTGNFSLKIKEITRYKEAEINQELFDNVFEPGMVTEEETFREKIKEFIALQLAVESDFKFRSDVYKYLEEKAGDIKLPETFLKRWLQTSPEYADADFRTITETLKHQVIKEQLVNDYKIEVTDNDVRETAKQVIRDQFARFGKTHVPDRQLESHVREILDKEETVRRLTNASIETKLTALFKEKLTPETRTVTVEEFQNILSGKQVDR
jgi:trigger factor